MTNLQLLLSIGIPSLLVLVSIALGTWAIKDLRGEFRGDLKDIRSEMHEFRREVLQRLDRVDDDLRAFYSITGKLEGRIIALEKR